MCLICRAALNISLVSKGAAVVPPSVVGGLLGTVWFISMGKLDEPMASDLNSGFSMVKTNLVNFIFTSFILGYFLYVPFCGFV